MSSDVHQVSIGDAAVYSHQLEETHGVIVVWRMRYHEYRQKVKFSITVTAYHDEPDGSRRELCSEYASYPSALHRTFPGAVLGALLSLDGAITAQKYLRSMGADPATGNAL